MATFVRDRSAAEAADKSSVRLSLKVSSELNEVLERMARRSGTTKSDVLRRALTLMEAAQEAKGDGKKVGVARDGTLETEFVGF